MSEFAGLALFGVVVGLVICASAALLYCLYVTLCVRKRPEPLANNENPV
jgi:hypothetical protein